jgi:hypothetical protein
MMPTPGDPRGLVPRHLCPFKDEVCARNACPTCCTGGSLAPEDRAARLHTLSKSEVFDFSPQMRADFAEAALAAESTPSGEGRTSGAFIGSAPCPQA